MMRQRRGSNNRRQGRIESKGPIAVIYAVIATLMTMTTASKTTMRVKAYNLLTAPAVSLL
jgi:hypothetical protein